MGISSLSGLASHLPGCQNEPSFPNACNVRKSSERYSLLRERMSGPRRSRHIDPLKANAQSASGIMASSEMGSYNDQFLTCSSDRKRFIWLHADLAETSPPNSLESGTFIWPTVVGGSTSRIASSCMRMRIGSPQSRQRVSMRTSIPGKSQRTASTSSPH